MPKTVILALALLLSAWLQAQTRDTTSQTNPDSSQNMVEGCLQGSNGNFTLTDNSGITYRLQGDTKKLSDHVGHEVEITGTTSGQTSASSDSAMSSGKSGGSEQPTLTITKVKHMSKTCKMASK